MTQQTLTQEVSAAAPWFAHVPGRVFVISASSAPVTVQFLRDQRVIGQTIGAAQGYKAAPPGGFDGFRLLSLVLQTVTVQVTDGDIDETNSPSAIAQAIDQLLRATPLPVSNDRGSPGNLMHVTGVSINDAPAVAISSNAPVACSPVAAVVAAADANRRAIRFSNLGPDPVALGPAGLTWAQRVIVLEVGDVWIEDRAANLAWSAITDAGDAASVTWQGITA